MYAMMNYWGYVKKEDAKEMLIRQTVMGKVFVVAVLIVYAVLQFMVAPRLNALYDEFGLAIPVWAGSEARLAVFAAAVVMLLAVKPRPASDTERMLTGFKSGEMILMSKITDSKYVYTVFGIALVSMLYIIISVVLPVYSITSSIR